MYVVLSDVFFFTNQAEELLIIYIYYISITKASKISTQIFSLVRWFGLPVLLTGGS